MATGDGFRASWHHVDGGMLLRDPNSISGNSGTPVDIIRDILAWRHVLGYFIDRVKMEIDLIHKT